MKKKPRRPLVDAKELRRLAPLARSFLPEGRDWFEGRRMSNGRAVYEAALDLGVAAGTLFGAWHPVFLRTVALMLSRISDDEAVARALAILKQVEALDRRTQARLRREVARAWNAARATDACPAARRKPGARARSRRRPR